MFTDEELIDPIYTSAVYYISEKGVINGFPDGTFNPHGQLTREQAAKIIVYLLIGPERAELLVCSHSPFEDVEQVRWSAPYIEWCCEKGIINGYGNNTFGPTDTLTGKQFAKMLLCAYYGAQDGRYTGEEWSAHVEEDGNTYSLFKNDKDMCSDNPLLRQQTALMAYNIMIGHNGTEIKDGDFVDSEHESYPSIDYNDKRITAFEGDVWIPNTEDYVDYNEKDPELTSTTQEQSENTEEEDLNQHYRDPNETEEDDNF